MGTEILDVSDRLLAAVMNGIYQGILVTVLVALSFRMFSRTNAATRHAAWLCTLVLLVLLVVAHCFFHSRPPALQRGNNARTAPTPEQEIGTPNVAAVDLFSVVGTSRCDVRAACSGAISSNARVARIFVPPATTRAGTAQRAIPTITLNTYAAMAATPNGLPTEIGSSGPKWPGSLPDEQEQLDDCVTISGHAGSFLQTHPLPLPSPFRGERVPVVEVRGTLHVQNLLRGYAAGQKPDSRSLSPMELPDELQKSSVGSSPPPGATLRGGEPDSPSIAVERLAASTAHDQSAWLYTTMRRLANPVSLTLGLGSRAARISGAILLSVCLMLSAARLFMLLLRLRQIRKLKLQSFPASEALNELFQGLITRLGVGRKVDLKTLTTAQSSFVLGFLHPVILLPAERMEPAAVEQILRHELAHVRRRDDWANLLQHFLLAAFPFHPAVWWISKRLSLEREIACDDYVLQASAQPHAYALLLANLAARMQRGPPLLAPGASNNKTQLQQRIDMILNTRRNTSPRLAASRLTFMASAAALCAITAICLAPRIVLAQGDPAPPAAKTQGSPVAEPVNATPAVASVAVSFSPEAGEAASRDAALLATPKPPAIGSRPKMKTGHSSAVSGQPAVLPAPATPAVLAAPSALTAPLAPEISQGSFVLSAASAPEPRPARAESADSTLEERLERLEKMVESLMARGYATPNPHPMKPSADNVGSMDRKEIAEMEARHFAEISRKLERDEIEKFKEQAKVEAARAADQVKRAAVDAEKVARAGQKRQAVNLNQLLDDYAELTGRTVLRPNSLPNPQISLNTPLPSTKREAIEALESTLASNGIAMIQVGEKFVKAVPTTQALRESANRRVFKEDSQKQLDELRKRLENLEREREKLERQIEQLERNQEQLEEQPEEELDSDAQSDTSEFNSDSPPRQ